MSAERGERAKPSAARPRRRAGFTIIETVVASAIGVVILGGVLSLSQSVAGAYKGVSGVAGMAETRASAVDALRSELGRCRIQAVAADGSSIKCALPVPGGTFGGYLDDDGKVIYGTADETGVHVDETVTLAFAVKRLVSESSAGDLNRDGDKVDVYEVGTLTKTTSAGKPLGCPRCDVIRLKGAPTADLDKDAKPDPLFSYDSLTNRLTVAMARISTKGVIEVYRTMYCPAEAKLETTP